MFTPLSLYIGLRYTRAKRRNHFISFISLASMLGIALGVAVLITVLSVMNGFDHEIRHKIFAAAPQVTLGNTTGNVMQWQALAQRVQKTPGVVAIAPFVAGQGMLTAAGQSQPVMVTGILPSAQSQVANLDQKMLEGQFSALQAGKYGIILGEGVADTLGVDVGDKVRLLVPQVTLTPMGMIPTLRAFTVQGIFHVGGGFGMDRNAAFIHLQDAQTLFMLPHAVTGLRFKVDNLYAAPAVAKRLRAQVGDEFWVRDWTEQYDEFFHAVRMEKTMMFLILLLIIAVAAFNLVSTLVMVVQDKRAEIAILRTLGASRHTILFAFMVQGSVIGVVGTVLGVIGGILLALNATAIVNFLQAITGVQLISASVYAINFLPSQLSSHDIVQVSVLALLLSLLAALYPAWQASRTQPAEALRYE